MNNLPARPSQRNEDSIYSKDFQSAVGPEAYQQMKGDIGSFRGYQDPNLKPSLYAHKQSGYMQKKSQYGRPSTRSFKESIFGGRRQSNY